MTRYVVSHPPEDRCCHCGKALEMDIHLDEETGEEVARLIIGGGRLEVDFGYGSCHDLRHLVMYICDECIIPFVDSRKSKVGEYCCMWYDEDKRLSPNCVIDQTYSGRHRAALEESGVRFVTLEEMEAAFADDPKGRRIDECKTENPPGDGSSTSSPPKPTSCGESPP